jgi:hypothetical protein
MEPVKPMDIVRQNELVDEVLKLTDSDQQKRMIKACLLLFSAKEVRWAVRSYLDFEENEEGLKKLLKKPGGEDGIIALISAEQLSDLLKDCLCSLASPEFKRLLYSFVEEVHDFNRLIREAGGRTVVPYEVD